MTRKQDVGASSLLCTRPTFSHSVMVDVSKFCRTQLLFVKSGTKIDGVYTIDKCKKTVVYLQLITAK